MPRSKNDNAINVVPEKGATPAEVMFVKEQQNELTEFIEAFVANFASGGLATAATEEDTPMEDVGV